MDTFNLQYKLLFSTLTLTLSIASFALQACIEKDENETKDEEFLLNFLSSSAHLHQIAEEEKEKENERKRKREDEEQFPLEDVSFNVELLDEILLRVFSFLNQKDIPSVTGTSKRWQQLMQDNQLWKTYAKKAFIIVNEPSQERNYKDLVKFHCTPSFTALDIQPIKWISSEVYSITSDGSMILGRTYNKSNAGGSSRVFLWTQEKEIKYLDLDVFSGGVRAMSFDGSVIIGTAVEEITEDKRRMRAFRWTQEKGIEYLDNSESSTWAHALNFDGSVVAGMTLKSITEISAFRWTPARGLESMKDGEGSCPDALNFDGSVVVGYVTTPQSQATAFRWTWENGMESLGHLEDGGTSWSYGVSFDGSIVVGLAYDKQGYQKAFRWTQEKGMEPLAYLNNCAYSRASTISGDGSVIVGSIGKGTTEDPKRAFRWTQEKGIEGIEKLLNDRNLLPPDWRLTEVKAVTPNGAVLIGHAECEVQKEFYPPVKTMAWRAVISRGNLF